LACILAVDLIDATYCPQPPSGCREKTPKSTISIRVIKNGVFPVGENYSVLQLICLMELLKLLLLFRYVCLQERGPTIIGEAYHFLRFLFLSYVMQL